MGCSSTNADCRAGDYSGPVALARFCANGACRRRCSRPRVAESCVAGSPSARRRSRSSHNISSDHFGEYGIHDLDALAAVKLVVANLLGADGLLVVNADNPLLRARAASTGRVLSWFARHADDAMLLAHRAQGGATAGVRAGGSWPGSTAAGGSRRHRCDAAHRRWQRVYNVANLAAAGSRPSRSGSPRRPSPRCTHASVRKRATTRAD